MKSRKFQTLVLVSTLLLAGLVYADGTSSGRLQLFADTKGNYYGCIPGSQEKGPNTSQCSALAATVVNQVKASGVSVPLFPGLTAASTQGTSTGSTSGRDSAGSTTHTTVGDVDTESTRVTVSTPQGMLTCPVTAFSSEKRLDPANCSPATGKSEDARIVCVAPVSSTPIGAPASTATTTAPASGATAATGTATLICALPGETYSKNPLPKTNGYCPGGGTRTVVGGFDTKTGEVDVTVTMTSCVDEHGNSHTGTASMQGTLNLAASKTVPNPATTYDMDETKVISSTVTFKSGGQVSRQCTVTRVGTYDDKTGTFNGTVSRNNCTLKGDYRFRPGLVDNLVGNASEVEPI